MKKTIATAVIFSILTVFGYSQSADDIINKHIDAMGGKDKLSQLKNAYMEGEIDAGSTKIPFKIWQINKKSMRMEYEYGGMKGYQIVRNDSGWNYSPMNGQKTPEPMTPQMVKSAQTDLDLEGTLCNYKAKGYKVEYEGKDQAEGSDTYKIRETISDSLSLTFFIDPDTYYVIQMKTKANINGKVMEQTQTLGDYKKTPEGYVFPMEMTGGNGNMKLISVKINTDINNDLFKPSTKM